MRRADLLQLEQIAAGYPSRERFLTELTLDPPDATSDQAGPPHLDEDYLILSTIHSAKGQEWTTVFVLNVGRRLHPVRPRHRRRRGDRGGAAAALRRDDARARTSCTSIVPQRFYTHGQAAHGDRHVYASRTRFIPDRILDRFESCAWPKASAGPGATGRPAVHVDLRARMRGAWK